MIKGKTGVIAAAALLASVCSGIGPASAATVTEALNLIEAARAELADIQFVSRNASRDEASLNSKLDAAKTKVNQIKLDDAIGKLDDTAAAVIAMRDAAKPKIVDPSDNGVDDIQDILNAIADAIAAINALKSA